VAVWVDAADVVDAVDVAVDAVDVVVDVAVAEVTAVLPSTNAAPSSWCPNST
jgi:hypothetical protein